MVIHLYPNTKQNAHTMKEATSQISLVQEAINLFVETAPMHTMNIEDNEVLFYHLYEQECKLFDCLGRMNESESEEYRAKVKLIEMKSKLESRLSEITIEMTKSEYKPLYYLQQDWITLKAKRDLLKELLEYFTSI